MITTVTPNPSVDRTIEVDRLEPGQVIRIQSTTDEPGGKGINIARSIASQGIHTRAIFPAGAASGLALTGLIEQSLVEQSLVEQRSAGTVEGERGPLEIRVVDTSAAVRTNITIIDSQGVTTKLNEPGPTLTGDDEEALLVEAGEAAAHSSWIVGSGSLPPGIASGFYVRLAETARNEGVNIAVDTSGPALLAMVGTPCSLLKPNRQELASIVDQPISTLGDVVEAAGRLRAGGAGAVLVSLGSDGAVLVDDTGVFHGMARTDRIVNTVGAGDALLAGFLLGGAVGREALASALAWGRSTVGSMSTLAPPDKHDYQAVSVTTSIEGKRLLEDDA